MGGGRFVPFKDGSSGVEIVAISVVERHRDGLPGNAAGADRIGQLRYVDGLEALLAKDLQVARKVLGRDAQAPWVDGVLGNPMVDEDQSTGDIAALERQPAAMD